MKNDLIVADAYRTNALSLKPGGSIVTVVYNNGQRRLYKNIKRPERYANSIYSEDIKEIHIDEQVYWKRK